MLSAAASLALVLGLTSIDTWLAILLIAIALRCAVRGRAPAGIRFATCGWVVVCLRCVCEPVLAALVNPDIFNAQFVAGTTVNQSRGRLALPLFLLTGISLIYLNRPALRAELRTNSLWIMTSFVFAAIVWGAVPIEHLFRYAEIDVEPILIIHSAFRYSTLAAAALASAAVSVVWQVQRKPEVAIPALLISWALAVQHMVEQLRPSAMKSCPTLVYLRNCKSRNS